MDFLTELLISFVIGVMIYFGLRKVNISEDKAQLIAVFLGGWVFAQIPRHTRVASTDYELKLINSYSTMRSYFVGLILSAFIAAKYLDI